MEKLIIPSIKEKSQWVKENVLRQDVKFTINR